MGRLLKYAGLFAAAAIVLFAASRFLSRSSPQGNEWPALQKKLTDLKLQRATREEAIQVLGGHRDISAGTEGAAGLHEYLQRELKHNPRNDDLLQVAQKWSKWTNGISQSTPYSRAWVFFDESNRVSDFVLLGN